MKTYRVYTPTSEILIEADRVDLSMNIYYLRDAEDEVVGMFRADAIIGVADSAKLTAQAL